MSSFNLFRTPGCPGYHSKYLQYSDHDWKFNNILQYNLADRHCSKSEAVIAESERLCRETSERTQKTTTQVERRFDERISDVDHWCNEGDMCIAKLQDTLDKLLHFKTRLKKALDACNDPLLACKKALLERDKRLGADMVHDKPQMEIQNYQIILEDMSGILEKAVEDCEDQMIADRAIKQRLLRDVTDKQVALEIDTHAAGCRPENAVPKSFKFDPDLMSHEKGAITLADWERSTRHNIEKAEQEIKKSAAFGARVEEILHETFTKLTHQRQQVVNALQDRVKELTTAQKNLEQRLGRILKQILEMDETLRKLDLSLDGKLRVLHLAANRMESRRQRPRNELCRDLVDTELEEEVRLLTLSLHQLRDQKAQASDMRRKLEQTKQALQKEIEIKKNSIFIDQDKCMNVFAVIAHIKH